MPAVLTVKKGSKTVAGHAVRCRAGHNGFVHVTSPASATEIRKTYRITKSHANRILGKLREAGVKI